METVEVERKTAENSENNENNNVDLLKEKVEENSELIKNGQEQEPAEKSDKQPAAKDAGDFAYLERDEFTSEIYKIEVRNLGYFGVGEFKKLIKNKLKLDMTKVKSPMRKEFAYVCFRNNKEKERAIELLNGYKWKGKVLSAQSAKAAADPLQKKRRQDNEDNNAQQKKKPRTSAEATCPLHEMPYAEQLTQKSNNIQSTLQSFVNNLNRMNSDFKNHKFLYDKGALVKPSPQIDGYRNKSEFSVGRNSAGEVVVGFRLGCYADGSIEVAEIQELPHLPAAAKWVARTFQQFMRKYGDNYLPFNPESNSGHVRQVMARTTRHSDEIMIMPGINTDNMKPEEVEQFKKQLKNFYMWGEGEQEEGDDAAKVEDRTFKCTSLHVQDVKRRKPGQMVCPVEQIAGTAYITEMLLDLKFAISPLAFFQVNTPAAEILYQTAIDLAKPKASTFLLDICCGTGTIGLAFAKHCRQVCGVDIVEDAIADAKRNAKANGIENCKFYAGNADDMIKSMVRDISYTHPDEKDNLDLIAVVDPPRSGLHNRSIHAIRATAAIKRLVYISCSPESAKRNWLDLGRPESKQYSGEPFFPKQAIAVDLFPHTMHTELVILFERAGGAGGDAGGDAGGVKSETVAVETTATAEAAEEAVESTETEAASTETVDEVKAETQA